MASPMTPPETPGRRIRQAADDRHFRPKKTPAEPGFFVTASENQAIGMIFVACMPFGPRTATNSTFWPSASDLKPLPP